LKTKGINPCFTGEGDFEAKPKNRGDTQTSDKKMKEIDK